MPAQLERADMLRVAHSIGKRGGQLPAEMANDPDYKAAHARGAGNHGRAAGFHPPTRPRTQPATPAPSSPTATPAKRPAATRSGSSKRGYLDRAFSPTAAADRVGAGSIAGAGDAGGLLLMLVLYPLLLSVVKYGAVGPALWFQAKWLNKSFTAAQVKEAVTRGSLGSTKGPVPSGGGSNYVDRDGYRYPGGFFGKTRVTPDGKTEKNPNYDPSKPQVT